MKSKLVLFFFLLGSIGTIAAVAQEIHPDLEIRVQEYLGAGELNKKVYAEIKTNVAEDSKIICWSGLKRLVLMYQGEKLIYEFSSQAVCESVLNCTRLINGSNGELVISFKKGTKTMTRVDMPEICKSVP